MMLEYQFVWGVTPCVLAHVNAHGLCLVFLSHFRQMFETSSLTEPKLALQAGQPPI